jgi:hypothetical protein
MRAAVRLIVFAALVAVGTVLGGWWTVPLLAALWVRLLPTGRGIRRTTALGGALGWGAILGWSARHGPVPAVATRMSAALDLPPWGFAAASLIFPALLAAAAADLFMTHRR